MWAKFGMLPRWAKFAIWMVPAVMVMVVLVVILVELLTPHDYDRVTIANNDVLEGVSGKSVNDFRASLLGLLQDEGLINEEMTVDDVAIREGTVDVFRNGEDGTVTTFLADIDSLKQTYRVRVTDTDKEMTDITVYITCPKAEEMKYTDAECRGHYGSTSESVGQYLPYLGVLAGGEKYLIKTITQTNTGEQVLQIYLYSCGADPTILSGEVETAVKELVQSIGDASEYVYNVRTGYCEGDAI